MRKKKDVMMISLWQFYRELDEEERCDDDQPVVEDQTVLGKHMKSVCRP